MEKCREQMALPTVQRPRRSLSAHIAGAYSPTTLMCVLRVKAQHKRCSRIKKARNLQKKLRLRARFGKTLAILEARKYAVSIKDILNYEDSIKIALWKNDPACLSCANRITYEDAAICKFMIVKEPGYSCIAYREIKGD